MKRVLVVNPFGIGDALFTMVLVEAIRSRYPECFIGFLCNERTVELVRMDASIDRTFVFNRDRFRKLWNKHPFLFYWKLKALLRVIRESNFDTLFDLSLGREYSFFGWWVGIRKRIGLDYRGRGLFLTHKLKIAGYENKPVADYQLELLRLAGETRPEAVPRPDFRVPEEVKAALEIRLRKNGIGPEERILAIAPGGGRSWGANAKYKQWDAACFAQVSKKLGKTHPHRVCLVGDRSEEGLLRQTQELLGVKSEVFAGEPLSRVSALLKRSWILLCNDGGLLHLANALGVKTASIFGPVDEKVYGPYYKDKPHAVLTTRVPCRPCYKKFYFPPCPHHRRCLEEISVETVLAAIKEIA
ncbi:MAG: hypothetical protein A3C47_01245 [Omnitrophica bacterium RIFCSPHIGHO2_02_FULL_51_18]|nr:MAG: hypothetical protein A3C47_01245 [Omnitrophica bacterium RIFCSPHIGHO2_02_FULL_51_18]